LFLLHLGKINLIKILRFLNKTRLTESGKKANISLLGKQDQECEIELLPVSVSFLLFQPLIQIIALVSLLAEQIERRSGKVEGAFAGILLDSHILLQLSRYHIGQTQPRHTQHRSAHSSRVFRFLIRFLK